MARRDGFTRRVTLAAGAAGLSALMIATVAMAGSPKTKLVSVGPSGVPDAELSTMGSLNVDGSLIAYLSESDDLINGNPSSGLRGVFVRNRKKGRNQFLHKSSAGVAATTPIDSAAISRGGRFVVFASPADNLVPGDNNNHIDVFVRDRKKGKTKRVSIRTDGGQAANGHSRGGSISEDGRYVVFNSAANNLVPGDDNGKRDIFLHDRKKGKTRRISRHSNGTQADDHSGSSVISADGRFVAYDSSATNLVNNDGNAAIDIFLYDRLRKKTRRLSVSSSEKQGNGDSRVPQISATGRYITFSSEAENLVGNDSNLKRDVFIRDRRKGRTKRVSIRGKATQANNISASSGVSDNGRFVTFSSSADDLVANDGNNVSDVFIRDRRKSKTKRVSIRTGGAEATKAVYGGALSGDGRFVTFQTDSALVSKDTNNKEDVYVRGPLR